MFSNYLFFLSQSLKIYKNFYLVKLLTICHCEYRLYIKKVQFYCIGTFKSKKRECNKLTIVTSKAMILFTSLKKGKEKFLFRTDLVEQKDEVATVCAHNKALILNRHLQKYCCNPFKTHKKIFTKICR